MESVTFREGTWHHKLARLGGHWRQHTDICEYSRAVGWGFCKLVFIVASALFATYLVGDWLAWIAGGIAFSFVRPHVAAAIVNFALSASGVLLALVLFGYGVGEVLFPAIERMGDGFVSSAWRSFKDKVCFRVELK